MIYKVQILAIWSMVMLLIPASAIYLIDNYETGVVRGAIEDKGVGMFSQGYAHSLPAGDMVSAQDKADLEWYWGVSTNVDDTYWDTAIYGQYPIFYSFRGRDSVSTIGDDNIVVNNYTGFGTGNLDVTHWTSLTAYELAGYDAIALNSTMFGNITDLDYDIWLFAADGSADVNIYLDTIRVDNQTIVWLISLDDKTDLLALGHDARVWLAFQNFAGKPDIYEWSLEMLTLETEFGVDPMTSYGILLLFMITTSVYTMIFATDMVDIKLKRRR